MAPNTSGTGLAGTSPYGRCK